MKMKQCELDRYSKTYSVYSHIIDLQKFLANVSQLYLGINAAVWIVILSNNYSLGITEKSVLLGMLAFSSVWLSWLFIGITSAIKLRFILLEKIGKEYFPGIKAMGENSYTEAYKGFSILGNASWGKSRWFWFVFPAAGLVINSYLLLRVIYSCN